MSGAGRLRALALAAAAVLCMAAADNPSERLKDPAREAHARSLFRQFRCVVCQNESIDDSDADLAHDLRRIIRQQVAQGHSDAQIRAFLVERYGEFILLEPRFSIGNAVLWLSPALIVLAGGALFVRRLRRRVDLEPGLSATEEMQVNALAACGGNDAHGSNNGPVGGAQADEKVT
jgi:cytochrome c-type biogenesis protein CcmH